VLTIIVAALAVPLYYYRHRIVDRFQGRIQGTKEQKEKEAGS